MSLFIHKKEFSTNIKINRVLTVDDIPNYDKYIYFDDPDTKGEYVVFEPQNCIFKKVKYYSVKFTNRGLRQDKCIKTFNNISSANGVIINSYFPCGIPSRMIKWYGDGGIVGSYILAENGKNGNVDLIHYIYQFGIIQNIRKVLNI